MKNTQVARLLAEGKRACEVAQVTGLTVSRVGCLQSDPIMLGLIDYSRGRVAGINDEVFAGVRVKAALLRMNALDLMNERYEETPELISHAEARADLGMANEMLDERVSQSLHLHGDLGDLSLAELVDKRRARADALANGAESLEQRASLSLPVGAREPGPLVDGAGSDGNGAVPAPTNKDD